MYIKQAINLALDYIEENLKNEITLAGAASAAGYSEFHFARMFEAETGLTPARYVRKRRISEIVRELSRSNRPVSDIAFEFGFNSKENFTRAFKAEHHILPTEYKSALNSLKLYDRLTLESAPLELEPEIVTLEGFSLTVYPSNEDIPSNFWNRYNSRGLSKLLTGGKVCEDYGVMRWNYEKDKLDYFIGVRTSNSAGDTSGTVQIDVSGGLYAEFTTPQATHFDFISTIHQTWDYINNIWLPQSLFKLTDGYEFECYVEESRTFREKIYIPIVNK